MTSLIIEFIYRLIVTILILTPAITSIVVAFTIIYNKDFGPEKPPHHRRTRRKSSNKPHEP